jgi:SAM-dependent methyltransferase
MGGRDRSRLVKVVRGGLWAVAAAQVAYGLFLRQRRRNLGALPPLAGDDADHRSAALPVASLDVVAMPGTEVDDVTLAEVAALMADGELEVVDLVPGDLAPERMLCLLLHVDASRRAEAMYAPAGAHEALVVHPAVARRLGLDDHPLDRGDLVRRTLTAQRYAPGRTDVRIAPRVRASQFTTSDHWREMEELGAGYRLFADPVPAIVALKSTHLAALAAGLVVAPVPALAALGAWSVQPVLALAGHGAPVGGPGPSLVDLWRASARRPFGAVAEVLRLHRIRRAQRRPDDAVKAAPPMEELFEARSGTCPWCGSRDLRGRLDTTDFIQFKPGRFHLDECGDCGHVFQNPMLSPAGLDYYYDEFYDGFGEEHFEQTFAAMEGAYEGRIDAVAAFTEPTTWLDVGFGHGHFCLAARRRWPGATFEGLDMSASVAEAQRRGWIDRAHRGQFPFLAEDLASSYDVVSMNHYLEHTVEPRRELAAAARVLVPGGHLLVEVPDAATAWTRLGRFWHGWSQPRHLHFFTPENLVAELEAQGFEVLALDRRCSEVAGTFVVGVAALAMEWAGPPRMPWLPAPTTARRIVRPLVLAASLPVLIGAGVADQAINLWERRQSASTPGNAFRIVARRA